MGKPDWKDAPEWATHLLRRIFGLGDYYWGVLDGDGRLRAFPGGMFFDLCKFEISERRP